MVERYDALVLAERPVDARPGDGRGRLLADAWLARGPREDDAQLLRRLRFAGRERRRCRGRRPRGRVRRASLDDVDARERRCRPTLVRALDRDAPEHASSVPSGRTVAARVRGGRQRVGVGEAAGALRAGRDAAHRSAPRAGAARAARAERPAGADRRAICAASGTARIRRSARNCAGAIRSTRGRTIRGPRRRPRAPGSRRDANADASGVLGERAEERLARARGVEAEAHQADDEDDGDVAANAHQADGTCDNGTEVIVLSTSSPTDVVSRPKRRTDRTRMPMMIRPKPACAHRR